MSKIEELAGALEAEVSENGFLTNCPAHPDQDKNLHVYEDNGEICFNCQVGCRNFEVADAFERLGIWPEKPTLDLDATDIHGGSADQHSSETKIVAKPLSAIEAREADWLVSGLIPTGCLTMLEGDGGIGKSMVVASIASALSTGTEILGSKQKAPVKVLLLAAEDDPAVVLRPRFDAHDANLEMIHIDEQSVLLSDDAIRCLDKLIKANSYKLLVIDPIVSYLGRGIDMSKANDVRSVLKPLADIARENGCAIVIVRHWNKNAGAQASHRGSGSVDFRNAARSVLQVIKNGDQRYLALEKSNYGAARKTFTFTIEGKRIKWTGTSDLSPDDILAQVAQAQGDNSNRSQLDDAIIFLKEELSNRTVETPTLVKNARANGISERTLERARKKLGVRSYAGKGVDAGKWFCELPKVESNQVRQDSMHGEHGGDGGDGGDNKRQIYLNNDSMYNRQDRQDRQLLHASLIGGDGNHTPGKTTEISV